LQFACKMGRILLISLRPRVPTANTLLKRFMERKQKAKQPGARENTAAGLGTKIVPLFLAAMLQWAAVLVVCPSLHELVHHDADDEHHDCAVTLFLAGQVEQPAMEPIVISHPAPVPLPLDQSYVPRWCGSFFLSCRQLEHAPPLRS
jgi:hypothetical protein